MFDLFNAKAKLNTNFLLWLIITAFFILISVALLTQVSTAHAALIDIFGGPIVPCTGGALDCTFEHLICLANNIILFLVGFTVIVAVLMFVYAGFLLVTAGSNEGQITRGKSIFWTVFIGLFIVLAAWLVINLIMTTFLNEDFGGWNPFRCPI